MAGHTVGRIVQVPSASRQEGSRPVAAFAVLCVRSMRRWGNASPGQARRVTVGTDWERYAAEQHPAGAYASRRARSSP